MGLLMLILVGIVPSVYALNLNLNAQDLHNLAASSQSAQAIIQKHTAGKTMDAETATKTLSAYLKKGGAFTNDVFVALAEKNSEVTAGMTGHQSLWELPESERLALRKSVYFTSETINKLNIDKQLTDANEATALLKYKTNGLDTTTKFIPIWVKVIVALALGLGTMIGWKRIVVTVGEKIGKSHLTYGQGVAAELVAMITIQLASKFGLPVSTTHVLSSGVAGAMAANKSGLQTSTLRNLLLAWVLTLPVCVFLGAMFFAGGLLIVAHVVGAH